ncbi:MULTISPECIES: AAA family ATPase [Citrobacter]|uniref:AAA family ATPase n=1 Tax=Citrobacter TaxID=544 RepID=UPI000E3BD5BA|nr:MULTISPECIES: AAA family ATPase [Citrobacter]MBD0828190.1 AAA family ATPase [Citrobacter sp. C1]RFU91872.1 hypothetical protein DZA29_10055 [Citrobacter gillenii]
MIKILVTGVFASGKTSFISLLKKELENNKKKVAFFSEVARECPFKLNHEQTITSTSWLVMRQIENEMIKLDSDYDFIIYDRGIPDIVAHAQLSEKKSDGYDFFVKQLERLGEESLKHFDFIFLSKRSNSMNIVTDSIRIDDSAYQRELEYVHIDYLKNTNSNFITLHEFNKDRIEQAMLLLV